MTFFNKFYASAIDEIMEYLEDNEIDETDLDNFKDKMTEEIFNTTKKFETQDDVLDLITGRELFRLMGYYTEIKDDIGSNTTDLLEICNIVYYYIGREQIHDEYEWEQIVENCRENKPDEPETIEINSSK